MKLLKQRIALKKQEVKAVEQVVAQHPYNPVWKRVLQTLQTELTILESERFLYESDNRVPGKSGS
jgi:hypothetical protein